VITAVDTNVLLDLFKPDDIDSPTSEEQLLESSRAGAIILSEPVYAELSSTFAEQSGLDQFLSETGIQLSPTGRKALHFAGQKWSEYAQRRPAGLTCHRCGAAQAIECSNCASELRSRQHVLADFIIGAHALEHADRLLTRDRGIYTTYFPELTLV